MSCLFCTCVFPAFEVHLRRGTSSSNLTRLVDFSPIVMSAPNSQPRDMTAEDFSNVNDFYSLPIGPDHLPTVIAAYATSISKNTKLLVPHTQTHNSSRFLGILPICRTANQYKRIFVKTNNDISRGLWQPVRDACILLSCLRSTFLQSVLAVMTPLEFWLCMKWETYSSTLETYG